ncbi:MAG: DUF4093 domain-containing protein [Oscillospiraceae bacterium]|nr:DUF4093 domain-containing protein [Oscillospiraceae bacterium]
MLKLKQTVIVEGKHDKIKLGSFLEANIIATDGFRIYSDNEKCALIKALAEKTGIIVLTDSDAAGRRIRNFIRGQAVGANIKNIYIPKIPGKERRKSSPSKENTLGVEGLNKELLFGIFQRFGLCEEIKDVPEAKKTKKITKLDFFADGLSGGFCSSKKRECFCKWLSLPCMSANALLECANILLDFDEYKKIMQEIEKIFVQLA